MLRRAPNYLVHLNGRVGIFNRAHYTETQKTVSFYYHQPCTKMSPSVYALLAGMFIHGTNFIPNFREDLVSRNRETSICKALFSSLKNENTIDVAFFKL